MENRNTMNRYSKQFIAPSLLKYGQLAFSSWFQVTFTLFLCFRLLKEPQDTLKTTTPLLNKVILTWLTDSYIYVRTPEAQRTVLGSPKPRGIGYGIGLAVALFIMQGISTFEFFIFPPLYVATQNLRAW